MGIFLRTDSDNVTHQVWAQEQASSCAVASIWMARTIAKQMTFNESEWALAWRMYGQVVQGMFLVSEPPPPMSLHPGAHQNDQDTFGNMFSRQGTFMRQVAATLRTDGLTITQQTGFSPGTAVVPGWLSDTRPAIILLGWYDGDRRRGGHFIVAARVTLSGRVVYLDPARGQLREMGVGPQYQATGRFEQVIYISA